MKNLYQYGTFVSNENCANSDIYPVPIWNNTDDMKNYLRDIRTARELTQEQLAEMVGTTHSTVQRHEAGKRTKRGLSQKWLERYAAALECHPSDITDGLGTMMAAQNEEERQMLSLWRGLTDADQKRFLHMAEAYAAAPTTPIKKTTS